MAARDRFRALFPRGRAILGMVHLQALPGAPLYGGDVDAVIAAALADADAMRRGGVDALIVENFNDNPFYPEHVEPETVAAMAIAVKEIVRGAGDTPVGVNVLRNDWKAALAVAATAGARFIRLNVLTDALVTDQGLIEAPAHLALRYRRTLGADHVLLFADLYSKHGAPLAPRPLPTVARDMAERAMADAIIVSGDESAQPPRQEDIAAVRRAVPEMPLILGSGMQPSTAHLLALADGAVFGYWAKRDDVVTNPVDPAKVRRFVSLAHASVL